MPVSGGKPQDSETAVWRVSEALCETIAWAALYEECCERDVEQESTMEFFGFYDILVLAIGGHFIVKIITTWLKTREGLTKRHVQHLEQRLHAVETQHLAEVQKRLSVLEEVFVLEDVALQRKLRQALGSDGLTPPSPSPTGKPPEHP
jgi:hypothetical protein